MPQIVRFHETGGPEVLRLEELQLDEPAAGEVRLKVEAFGLNNAEMLFRRGHYVTEPAFPSRIGIEAAGVVDAVGPGVGGIAVGDRVGTVPYQTLSPARTLCLSPLPAVAPGLPRYDSPKTLAHT